MSDYKPTTEDFRELMGEGLEAINLVNRYDGEDTELDVEACMVLFDEWVEELRWEKV